MSKNRENVFYQDYEDAIKKLEKSEKQNKELRSIIEDLKITIRRLESKQDKSNATIEKLNETISNLNNTISMLLNQASKNSKNSSMPPSKDKVKPKKSPNEYNLRTKSDKKSGGQKGHKGTGLTKEKAMELLKDPGVIYKEKIYKVKGDSKRQQIEKYELDIEINTIVTKKIYIFGNYREAKEEIQTTDVIYGKNIKTICTELCVHHSIAIKRLTEFIKSITNSKINLSPGTIINFIKEVSSKTKNTIDTLVEKLLVKNYLYTDATPSKGFDSNVFFRNYSTKDIVIFKANENKKNETIDKDNILPRYRNTLIHDHEVPIYNYGTRHVECNAHILRYLTEVKENTKTKWSQEMIDYLLELKHKKEECLAKEDYEFLKEEVMDKYRKILEEGLEENKQIELKYDKERANNLAKRMLKYADEHLRFYKEIEAPFDNNESERDLRMIKTKTKVSGCFRSLEGAKWFANIMSIIKTAVKKGINVHEAIIKILSNEVVFE